MKRQLGWIIFSLLIAVGCSNKTTAPVEVQPVANQQGDTEYNPTNNYQTAQNNNSNLWDTTTDNDTPAASATPTPTPSATPVASLPPPCLAVGGSNYNNGANPPWYGTASTAVNRACFDDSFGDMFGGDDWLFDAGLGGFGQMETCYQTVMARAPQMCTAGYGAEQVFKMSQMALTRCFRGILKAQRRMARWAPPQRESFENTDNSMWMLLQMFSQDDK